MSEQNHVTNAPVTPKVDAKELRNLKDIFRIREVNGGYEIYDGIEPDIEEYTVPDFVVSIGQHAFSQFEMLDHITIPASVKRIAPNAFEECSVSSLDIHFTQELMNNISASKYTLDNLFDSQLDEITYTFDQDVKKIPKGIFTDLSIEELDLRDTNVEIIENEAFADCDDLETIFFGDKVKTVEADAFSDCFGLVDVILTDNCPLSIRDLREIFDDCTITRG